jgi:uncharacterized protein (DUF1697 family)
MFNVGETRMSKSEYAAFLRGINVGGNTLVPMERLRRTFETLQFTNVRTVLASGNVLFEAPAMPVATMEKKIEKALETRLGKNIAVFVRTLDSLQRLAASGPFKEARVAPETRLYVTFLRGRPVKQQVRSNSPGGLRILHVSPGEVLSIVTPAPGTRTIDLMQFLEKEFGDRITTRNYTTILRVLKARISPDPAA